MNKSDLFWSKTKESVRILLDISWKLLSGISTIFGIVGVLTDFSFLKNHPYLGGYLILSLTLIGSLVWVIYKQLKNTLVSTAHFILQDELVNIVNFLYTEGKYLEVVRFGSTISRYLWLNGFNDERIMIGKKVEDSASKTGRINEQVCTLIDDLGWTNYVTGNTNIAIDNIKNGIEMASENGLFYYAAKGERHLYGIAKDMGKTEDLLIHLTNAEGHAGNITDSNLKAEIEASLSLSKAKYYFEQGDFILAEQLANSALQKFKFDMDRIVKIHSLLGNVYLKLNKRQKSKDEFNKGYDKCKGIRKDEYAKNAVGLAKIALMDHDTLTAKKYLHEANAIYGQLKKVKEKVEVENLLRNLI